MVTDVVATLIELKEGLDQAEVEYLIVGSLASSVHGLPRATRDAALIVLIGRQQVSRLATALKPRFYLSEDAALEAVRHGTSFNVIHEDTFFQVDFFVAEPTAFDKSQFDRRECIEIDPDRAFSMPFQSAEDSILSKLDWFRQGREVSARQWQDVMGILRAQGGSLDLGYLRRWAANLGVDDLLQRALEEVYPQSDTPEFDR
jgi:hypothetical protein